MRNIRVELAGRSYEMVVGEGILDSAADHLPASRHAGVALIGDETVDGLYGERLARALSIVGPVHRLTVPSSETAKSWSTAGELLGKLAELKMRRDDLVVTFGGGVASDLGGFVASVYQRGLALVHVPTTLLAQVDAAIGGKTGVNLEAGKNLAGTFYQPSAVIADVSVLRTLPSRQLRSGMAEVIKYGLCYEPRILQIVETQAQAIASFDSRVLEELIFRCARIKARVVSEDETDVSGRTILNYGHTFGHALEAAGSYQDWLHGEAISLGMMFAAWLAWAMGLLEEKAVQVHRRLLEGAGLPVQARFDPEQVIQAWSMDKKFSGGQRWVLLEALGKPVVRSDVRPRHIEAALDRVLTPPTALGAR